MNVKDFSGIRNNGPLPSCKDVAIAESVKDLLGDYIDETTSQLQVLEGIALSYGNDEEEKNEKCAHARRVLHNMKGEAGVLGIDDVNEFCHQIETALEELPLESHPDIILRFKDWLDIAIQHLTGTKSRASRVSTSEGPVEQLAAEETLKILIVEDDKTCRQVLLSFLKPIGNCDIAANGLEGLNAVKDAFEKGIIYDLICLDIMMPEMTGQEALVEIRNFEAANGIEGLDGSKIIMTTALDGSSDIFNAFKAGCEGYITKPVKKAELMAEIEKFGLIKI